MIEKYVKIHLLSIQEETLAVDHRFQRRDKPMRYKSLTVQLLVIWLANSPSPARQRKSSGRLSLICLWQNDTILCDLGTIKKNPNPNRP
jgi:hypothetical protein